MHVKRDARTPGVPVYVSAELLYHMLQPHSGAFDVFLDTVCLLDAGAEISKTAQHVGDFFLSGDKFVGPVRRVCYFSLLQLLLPVNDCFCDLLLCVFLFHGFPVLSVLLILYFIYTFEMCFYSSIIFSCKL